MSDRAERLGDVWPRDLQVVEYGRDGFVFAAGALRYVLVASVVDGGRFEFGLAPQPAWPALWERELREMLLTVYDSTGVDLWIRSACRRGLTIEEAKQHADGAFT